jgi:hypothetical protein
MSALMAHNAADDPCVNAQWPVVVRGASLISSTAAAAITIGGRPSHVWKERP